MQLVALPHASVVVHDLVIVYACGHAPSVVTSLYVTAGAGSQLSVALAIPVLSGDVDSSHSMVTSTGHVIDGGVESSTRIFCRHVVLFPQASVTSHVLAMDNSCGHAPGVTTS